jgi:hypothetical protein
MVKNQHCRRFARYLAQCYNPPDASGEETGVAKVKEGISSDIHSAFGYGQYPESSGE